MKEFISEDEVEKALNYLSKSAKDYAKWKSRVKFYEHHRKSIRAAESLIQKGNSMTENNAKAEASMNYKAVVVDYQEAVYEFTLIEAYRKAAESKIEAWRTISSSNRRGHV